MNIDAFKQILQDIGRHYRTTLEPDANHSCLISIRNAVKIQLELDKSQQFLIVGAALGELPPGKFREVFLKEALRANGAPYPRFGIFAYTPRRSSLILFEKFPIETSTHLIIEFLAPFTEKTLIWQEAVKNGNPPQLQYATQKSSKSGMFGL